MDDYWDKKATILKYHSEIYDAQKKDKIKTPPVTSSEELYRLAKDEVGEVSFQEQIDRLNIDKCFHSLSHKDTTIGITIGILGAITAIFTDIKGKPLEEYMFTEYDTSHPADYWLGYQHRYKFGHDITNPFQELPKGLLLNGKDVGGKSLFDMVAERYCGDMASPFGKLLGVVSHNFAHYLRDFITTDGLPLPGSSIFVSWEENVLNSSGFSGKNELMSTLGREFGTINISDFTSIVLMKILTKMYIKNAILKNPVMGNAKKIFTKQINIIAISTCLVMQIFLLLFHNLADPKFIANKPGAKLNIILFGLFIKNTVQLFRLTTKEHRDIIEYYDESIQVLKDGSVSLKEWEAIL